MLPRQESVPSLTQRQLELALRVGEADFEVHRILGRGASGAVFGCRKIDTGKMFAMKRLSKQPPPSNRQLSTSLEA